MRTYGAELELADIDQTRQLPEGCGWDRRDFSMVNSNGIAVDPKGISWKKGGEINTRPTETIFGQVEIFNEVKELFPEASVNYRSNLHCHVRIPGLKEDLAALKSLQSFIHTHLRPAIDILEPIPRPNIVQYPDSIMFEGAMWRFKRRKKSHQTFLTDQRLRKQLAATTLQEFFENEVPRSKEGQVMWHAQARLCVNLRQLKETDTIEFRHFPGTLNSLEFENALTWCDTFLNLWEKGASVEQVREAAVKFAPGLPKFEPYIHALELRYRRTCHDGSVPREDREQAIREILEEDNV